MQGGLQRAGREMGGGHRLEDARRCGRIAHANDGELGAELLLESAVLGQVISEHDGVAGNGALRAVGGCIGDALGGGGDTARLVVQHRAGGLEP